MLKTLNEKLLLLSADKDRQALLFDESMRGQRKENMQLKMDGVALQEEKQGVLAERDVILARLQVETAVLQVSNFSIFLLNFMMFHECIYNLCL